MLHLNGYEVCFPYSPYPDQIKYITSVLDALDNRQHSLLESPTGTGKTLCLLSSCLAWLSHQRAKHNSEKEYPNPELKAPESPELPPTRIIYTTRTHSQLKQVIKELKKTCYRPRVALIASRDKLCINSSLDKYSDRQKNIKCKELLKNQQCQYYKTKQRVMMVKSSLIENRQAADIEDLVELGTDHCACPFFISFFTSMQADLLLMPYNYLTDESIRQKYKDLLANAIIIFDEAHNIEAAAQDGASLSLSTSDLRTVLTELGQLKSIYKPKVKGSKKNKTPDSQKPDFDYLIDKVKEIDNRLQSRKKDYLKKQAADPSLSRYVDEVCPFHESASIFFGKQANHIGHQIAADQQQSELGPNNINQFFEMIKMIDSDIKTRHAQAISSGGISIHKFCSFLKVFVRLHDDMCNLQTRLDCTQAPPFDYVLNFKMNANATKGTIY